MATFLIVSRSGSHQLQILTTDAGRAVRLDSYNATRSAWQSHDVASTSQAEVVALALTVVAPQVSTPRGQARHLNRIAGGSLRALAPNTRHWTGRDMSLAETTTAPPAPPAPSAPNQ